MRILKKASSILLLSLMTLSLCSCSHTKSAPAESSVSAPTTENDMRIPATEETVAESASEPSEGDLGPITTDQLQSLYAKDNEYEYMALGYFESGLDDNGLVRYGYVPYDENFTQKEVGALESAAHGADIRLTMQKANSASEALDALYTDYSSRCESKGLTLVDKSDATTADNDTVGFIQGIYTNESGEDVYVILYADIRDDGSVYMCAEMEFTPSDFDDQTKALVAELDDVYALTLSSLGIFSSL